MVARIQGMKNRGGLSLDRCPHEAHIRMDGKGRPRMMNYSSMYRWGFTPWERYVRTAASSIAALLDREEAERVRPLGRALDLGCGRGLYTRDLARRGWDAVGIDIVQSAIDAARRADDAGVTYAVVDVTNLQSADLGTFDFFLDIGCFQGLRAEQRQNVGQGMTALANPGATMLLLAFGPTRMSTFIGGVAQADVEAALTEWDLNQVEPADTTGLGWPMNRTSPQWFRLRRQE